MNAPLVADCPQVEAEHRAAAARQQLRQRAWLAWPPAVGWSTAPPAMAARRTPPHCACSRRGAPCAAQRLDAPQDHQPRGRAPCRRRSRRPSRAARSRKAPTVPLPNTMPWSLVGGRQLRKRPGVPVERAAVDQHAADHRAVPGETWWPSGETRSAPWARASSARRGEGRIDQQRQPCLVRDRRRWGCPARPAPVAERLAEQQLSFGRIAARQPSMSPGLPRRWS